MIRKNFFNRLKDLILATLILCFLPIEDIMAKDPPPGSGSGDVPVNVLFLLDNSLSMRRQIIPGDGMWAPWDLVETDNGDMIISQVARRGLTKINYGTELRDTNFGRNGWFRGSRRDANCGNQDTRIRNAYQIGIDRVDTDDVTDDRIYVADWRSAKIVILNVDGECIDVIRPGFRPINITVRSYDGQAYLIAGGSNGRRIYSASLNSTTGMPETGAGICSQAPAETWRITSSLSIAMDGVDGTGATPNFLYAVWDGDIYRYPLTFDGNKYCPQANDITYRHDNGTESTTRHEPARTIELDPEDDDTIYIATKTHKITKYTMANPAVNNGLTEVWKKGTYGIGTTQSDANVLIRFPRGLFVGEGDVNTSGNGNALVYVGNYKPSVQTFDKDHASGQWQNELGGSIGSRMSGAKKAIKSIVTEPTLSSGANFGYGHWSAGIPGIISTRNAHRGRGNPDYYTGWTNDHPGVERSGNSAPCWRGVCIRVGVDRLTNSDIVTEVNRTPLIFGTDARAFSGMALDYFTDDAVSPRDTGLTCQQNYAVIIGDGAWNSHDDAEERISDLRTLHGVKTLVVAYGGGISENGLRNFGLMAQAGSCDTPCPAGDDTCVDECEPAIIADSPNSLLTQLQSKIEQIVANRLSFTAPSITATIEEGGSLYQAQFDYTHKQEWKGTINRKEIKSDGRLCDFYENAEGTIVCSCGARKECENGWSAAERTHTIRESRKIWTALGTGADYIQTDATAWNNWTTANATAISDLFGELGNEVVDFHRRTTDGSGSTAQRYCWDRTGDTSILDGNTDDISGLINFVRGKDYYNYEDPRDCDLDKWRSHIIGDIYHSQIVQVGPPNANTAFLGRNQEAFFRASNNYGHFIRDHENRETLLYAGSNTGVLHAFKGCEVGDGPCKEGGQERWGFIPPFVAAKLPKVSDISLNTQADGGGTNSIFGVDGSPVVHDMYISSNHDCPTEADGTVAECKQWRTIMVVPYGRGGAGYSVLDVTETEAANGHGPKHLFSIYNDSLENEVLVADYKGVITRFPYLARSYTLDESLEAETAERNIQNAADDAARDNIASCQTEATLTAAGQTFREDGTNGCYEGNTWTWSLPTHGNLLINDADNEDIQVFVDDQPLAKGNFTVTDDGAELTIKFSDTSVKRFRAHEVVADDPDDDTDTTDATSVEVYIANVDKLGIGDGTGVDEYSGYAFLGDTWSSPRIFRMPDKDNRNNPAEDKYVMVMGGGMSMKRGIGSNVFVINLENKEIPGEILKLINIPDSDANRISNAVPASPVVVTPDMTSGIEWRGGLVYINDLEGKVTKINLTSMTHASDSDETAPTTIALYDSTQIFDSQTNVTNARYMYHSMDIAVGRDTKKVWLYMGTGDYEDPNNTEPGIDNLLLGIKDPMRNWRYKDMNSPKNLDQCKLIGSNTTDCPDSSDAGWKVHLPNLQKVTAEPTIFQGNVYFPIYQPNADNPCSVGAAFICGADDECGTNNSGQIGSGTGNPADFADRDCHFAGFGILSEIVVFAGKLFANIAGLSEGKTTLVIKMAAPGEADSYRRSWKENF